jgi:hypothetical protein
VRRQVHFTPAAFSQATNELSSLQKAGSKDLVHVQFTKDRVNFRCQEGRLQRVQAPGKRRIRAPIANPGPRRLELRMCSLCLFGRQSQERLSVNQHTTGRTKLLFLFSFRVMRCLLSRSFLSFKWESETGRTYQVQISSDLLNGSVPQAGTEQPLGDSVHTGGDSRFVRVRIY